jgi:hypothetical protein
MIFSSNTVYNYFCQHLRESARQLLQVMNLWGIRWLYWPSTLFSGVAFTLCLPLCILTFYIESWIKNLSDLDKIVEFMQLLQGE